MALINLTPFDSTRRPGRPIRSVRTRGAPPVTATGTVKRTAKRRSLVSYNSIRDRRRCIERRYHYKLVKTEKRKNDRRVEDMVSAEISLSDQQLQPESIDIKI